MLFYFVYYVQMKEWPWQWWINVDIIHSPRRWGRKKGLALLALISIFGWSKMAAQSDTTRQELHTILTTDPRLDSLSINEEFFSVSLDSLAEVQKMRGEGANQREATNPWEIIGDETWRTVNDIEEHIEEWGRSNSINNENAPSPIQTIDNTHINEYLSTMWFTNQWSVAFPNHGKGAIYKPETEVQLVRNGKAYGIPLTLGDMYSYAFPWLSLPEWEVLPYEVLETTVAFFTNLETEEKTAMGNEWDWEKKAESTAHK